MPWSVGDVAGKTKKADTPKKKRRWVIIANGALASGKSEGEAIREANGVTARDYGLPKKKGKG